MKHVLLLMLAIISLSPAFAGDKKKSKAKKAASANEIEWISFDELERRMKKEPRKIYIDVYTDWCGWCKVMDKKTFTNPEVIKYINSKYYAVKLDAEWRSPIMFMGKTFPYNGQYKANMLAVELLHGQLSYPTTVILDEDFMNPQAMAGYLDVTAIEKLLKFIAEGHYKTRKYDEFEKTFVSTWKSSPAAEAEVTH